MRIFFALSLSGQCKLAMEQWRDCMFPRDLKAIPSDNFHITLAFLGELPSHKLDTLCTLTDDYLNHAQPHAFDLHVNECQYWTGSGILWIGPQNWPEGLTRLHKKLGHIGSQMGQAVQKKSFQPHISLFRGRTPVPKPISAPDFQVHCDQICLYESIQQRNGVRYDPVSSWDLAKAHYKKTGSRPRRPIKRSTV